MTKIKDAIEFITHDIWLKKEENYKSSKVRWAVRQAKVLILTAKGFGRHDIAVRSAALTFYTLMAIVPILALVFGVIKGFGLEDSMYQYLYGQFSQSYHAIIDTVINFANNMLSVRTSGGIIAGVGFVVLLYSVINVFSSIESAFNHIWEVRKQRSLPRKVSDYTTVIIVAPVLFIISNSLTNYIQKMLAVYTHEIILKVLFSLGSLVIIWLAFAFIYVVLPNTKVKIRGAIIAAIITGTIFVLFQQIYVLVQSYLTTYNAVYGSFAALPLFLIWLQTSWQILLLGAELSFAYQHIKRYEQELESQNISYDSRRRITLATMLAIIQNFIDGKAPMGSDDISESLNLPVRIVRDVTFALERAGLVIAASENGDKRNVFIPSRDVHDITVMDVIYRVEESGGAMDLKARSEDMTGVTEMFDKIKDSAITSGGNVRLVALLKESQK